MAGECKKLFRRDRTFLLCLTGLIVLVLLYGLTGCYKMIELQKMPAEGMDVEMYRMQSDMLWNLWGGENEAACYYDAMKAVFWVAAAALLVKWHMLEGRRGREFQKLLPVKSSSCITYDFICGLIFIWMPYILSWLVFCGFVGGLDYADHYVWISENVGMLFLVNTFLYVLLVFVKRITNNTQGLLLSAFVICFGLCFIEHSEFFAAVLPSESAVAGLLALTVLGVPATYLCDKKRDISGNGTFSFIPAHYLILGMLFLELAFVFSVPAEGKVPGMALGILLAGAVSYGIHYIAKPKRL